MSIPVEAMHATVRDEYLGAAETMIEADDGYKHAVANRDAVRLAYVLSHEAGNADQWDEAVATYRS
jgi:hypothetical protein